MPWMNVLNTVEREAFDSPPVFNSLQRKQYFDLPAKLHGFAAGLHHPAHRLGFLLSACERGLLQSGAEVLLAERFSAAGYRPCGAAA